ncbi:MAG: hypothetical protein M0R67_06840 [Candidatus Cloacimonas sp.]|nr:hypothetical protein [Candidatus Cloacimonas sp.]
MNEIKVFVSCPDKDPKLKGLVDELQNCAESFIPSAFQNDFCIKVLNWKQNDFVDADINKSPQQIIDDKTAEYDLYFGMMASRYGRIMEGYDISATEYELQRALQKKAENQTHIHPRVIVFSFLQQSNGTFSPDESENEKIKSFLERVRENAICHVYKNRNDIVKLFRDKLDECITTSCRKYEKPEEYKIDLKLITQKGKGIFWRINYLDLDTVLGQNTSQNPNNKIVIMDSGGSGKSTYLSYYAYKYSRILDKNNPVLIKLKNYNAQSIKDAVKEELKSFPDHLILLLDGYDELSDSGKTEFHKQLNVWNSEYSKIPIVITTRPTDLSTTPMRDYAIYSMAPLTNEQIINYSADRLKHLDFTANTVWSDIFSLAQNPFFLVKIVDYYQSLANLPGSITEIMDFAVKESIAQDKEHTETAFKSDYEYDELPETMSILAFCMTDCGLTSISRKDIQHIIADQKIENALQKYNKLIEISEINGERKYSFSHKLFQDYLAAQAFKNIKSPNELNYLFYAELILYNWEPVIPFIIELLSDDERNYLIERIKTLKPKSLINILPDFMNCEMQKDIFISIFESYSSTLRYIQLDINLNKLSRIWNTVEKENYLLNYIRNPKNKIDMIMNAFIILKYANNFDKQRIQQTLLECFKREDLKKYRKQLNNIATLFIDIDHFPFDLLKTLYDECKEDTVQLLTKYDYDFYYLDELLDIYVELSKQDRNYNKSELISFIEDYCINCFKSSHFNKFIDSFINKKMLHKTSFLSYRFYELVKIALNDHKEQEIYDSMYRLFLYYLQARSLSNDTNDTKKLIEYFKEIGKGYELVKRIFKEGKQKNYEYQLITLFQEDDNFVSRICKDLFPSLPEKTKIALISYLAIDNINPLYEKLLNEYQEQFIEARRNCTSARNKAHFKRDLDIILKINLLTKDLNNIFGSKESLTYEEFIEKDRLSFSWVNYSLLKYCFSKNPKVNKDDAVKMLKFNHDLLILRFIEYNFVKNKRLANQNKEDTPELTPKLKEWLQNRAKEFIKNCDIKNEITIISKTSFDITVRVLKFWNFVKAGLIKVPNRVLLDFISIVYVSDWEIIENLIGDKPLLKERVLENLKNKNNMSDEIIGNHIHFCVQNKYSEILPHTYEIMENWEKGYNNYYLLSTCVNALIKLEIDENWFNGYVSKCPENIVFYLAREFSWERKVMKGLIDRIKAEIQDANCEHYRAYIYYLCCFGDRDALPLYIEIIKEDKKFDFDYYPINPLDAYTNKADLKQLLDLLDFSFKNDIESSTYISLIESILSNLEQIAQENDSGNIIVKKLDCYTKKFKDHSQIYRIYDSISKIKTEFQRQYIENKSLNDSLAKYNNL